MGPVVQAYMYLLKLTQSLLWTLIPVYLVMRLKDFFQKIFAMRLDFDFSLT